MFLFSKLHLAKLSARARRAHIDTTCTRYNHYMFETMCCCIRYAVAVNPSTVAMFEAGLFPPFQTMLEEEVGIRGHPHPCAALALSLSLCFHFSRSLATDLKEHPGHNHCKAKDGRANRHPAPRSHTHALSLHT
jgi:hypothetical protein